MNDETQRPGRRSFLKAAGLLAASAAAGCEFESRPPEAQQAGTTAERQVGFDRALLDAVAEAVLPSELGARGRDTAVTQFIAWSDGYDPVAEEMHGYGYSDIRYLPPDPAPAWRAQLTGLTLLARKTHRTEFVRLDVDARRELLGIALQGERGDRLPSPLRARHVAVALLSHWASSPDAWDLALGAKVQPGQCRVLADANAKPLPITGLRA